MPTKLEFTLLCDDIRFESSGKLTLIGLYNYLIGFQLNGAQNVPSGAPYKFVMPQLCILRRWRTETPGERTSTEIIGPDGTVRAKIDTTLVPPPEEGFAQEILRFVGMPLDEGVHTIRTTCGSAIFIENFLVKAAYNVHAVQS